MSGLWTPGGEHPVPDHRSGGPDPELDALADRLDDLDDLQELDEETVLAELEEARRRVASVPASEVVANHAMGLFELAAIHLRTSPPQLGEAALAIDAMAALVDGLGDRLEPHAPVLRDALAQLRLAFVQVRSSGSASS